MAKVNIKSEKISPFGGFYYASKAFYALSLDKVINGTLGVRSSTYSGYQPCLTCSSMAATAWKMSIEASVTCGNHLKSGYVNTVHGGFPLPHCSATDTGKGQYT